MPWRQRAGAFSAWYQLSCEPTELLSKEESMLHLTTNKQKMQGLNNKSTNYTMEKEKQTTKHPQINADTPERKEERYLAQSGWSQVEEGSGSRQPSWAGFSENPAGRLGARRTPPSQQPRRPRPTPTPRAAAVWTSRPHGARRPNGQSAPALR